MFENPMFDLASSVRSLLKGTALEYISLGLEDLAMKCLDISAAIPAKLTSELWKEFAELTQSNNLKERRNNLYIHGVNGNYFDEMVEKSPLPAELWQRAEVHQKRLIEEGEIFNSTLKTPNELPACAALIIKGRYDYIASLDQIQAYVHARPRTRVLLCDNSSHFPHFEEPKEFAKMIKDFILG